MGRLFCPRHQVDQCGPGDEREVRLSGACRQGVEMMAEAVALGNSVAVNQARREKCGAHPRDLAFVSAQDVRDLLDAEAILTPGERRAQKLQDFEVSH